MLLLPIIITFIVLVIAMLVIAADYRVYLRRLRLDMMLPIYIISIVFSGILSFAILIVGGGK